MNILFVSLTRFGDLLQTQASITDVARAGHRVGVVCLQNFLPALHLMEHVEHVFPFIGNSLLAQLSFVTHDEADMALDDNAHGWLKATKELADWRDMLWREFRPDVVIGLSPARSSRLLTRYISQHAVVGGFSVDSHGALHNTSMWASIIQGASFQRGIIPYNLVDIFRAITSDTLDEAASSLYEPENNPDNVGKLAKIENRAPLSFAATKGQYGDNTLLAPPSSVANNTFNALDRDIQAMGFIGLMDVEHYRNPAMMSQLFMEAGNKTITGFVGMQLGASAIERQWPLTSFARVGDYLWDTYRLVPVLLGTKEEVPLTKKYEELANSPCILMAGKTGLVDLSAVLSHCLFLLTNDTGTMHLAAGLGVPSLAVFLATAQPFDTGPYLPGCYCFEPDLPCHPCNFNTPCPHDFVCRHSVAPETVIACVEHLLNNAAPQQDDLKGARVWLTTLDNTNAMSLKRLDGKNGAVKAISVTANQALKTNNVFGFDGGELDDKALYAVSRDGLVELQRAMMWFLVDRFCASRLERQRMTNEHAPARVSSPTESGGINSATLVFDVSVLPPLARAVMAEEALRLAGQLEILEKQGEVLLLRVVELMQKRFLQSWDGVSTLLRQSPWFCFLHSLWCDLTQARGLDFTEIMAGVRIFRELFVRCAASLASSEQP